MPTKNSVAANRFVVRFAGFLFAVAFCAASPWLAARAFRGAPQQTNDAPHDEVVANLASGRVVIAVVKDAILIATIENPIEPETRPPTPVQISIAAIATPAQNST